MGKMKQIAIERHNEGLDLDAISKKSKAAQDELDKTRAKAVSDERRTCDDCGALLDDCTCKKDLDPEDEWEDDTEDDDDE